MKMFTQEPEWIIGIGVVVVVGLVFAFLKTGAKPLLLTIGAVLALLVGLLVLERMVVTDEEELLETLDNLAIAIEQGDLDVVLQHVHPSAKKVIEDARRYHQQYKIQAVAITKIRKIIVNDQVPPTAEMHFIARVDGMIPATGGQIRGVSGVILHLSKVSGRWLVNKFEPKRSRRGRCGLLTRRAREAARPGWRTERAYPTCLGSDQHLVRLEYLIPVVTFSFGPSRHCLATFWQHTLRDWTDGVTLRDTNR